MTTDTQAVRLLAFAEQCTDAAVEKLETLAKLEANAQLLSNLAAAYFIRAQRKDRPSDFVRSLAAADRSVALDPTLAEARFNQALAQEALGFSLEATASWDALSKGRQQSWAAEARQHFEQLVSASNRAEAFQWSNNKSRLALVTALGDQSAVRQLVAPYPTSAQRYVEEVVLPAWAAASAGHRSAEAAVQLRQAEMIATGLAAVTNDRFLHDTVERIRTSAGPRAIQQLEQGHRALGTAREAQRSDRKPTYALYDQAALPLAQAASPMQFQAMIGKATALTIASKYDAAAALLRIVERAARERQYPTLLARVLASRGYLLMAQRRDIDAITEYSEAQSAYETTKDMEGVAAVRINIIGLYRRIGHEQLTWGAAYQALRHVDDLAEAQSRHVYLGENALSAIELGYPSVGLHYQDMAVRMLEDQLSRIGDDENPEQLRTNLGIALRARAGIHLELSDQAAAEADLAKSTRLLSDEKSRTGIATIPLAFRARLAEIDAQRLSKTDRHRAILKLSEAIRLSSVTIFQTLIASLRLQRAELYSLEGNRAAAADDLKTAIQILRDEERAALKSNGAQQTAAEELWSAYFSRAQDTYRRLIRLYVEDGADAEAFEYAEKARAYEPLHLVLQRPDLPRSFRERIHDDEPFRLEDVKQTLPAGVVLLHYSVLENQTYVWIIGRGFSERRTLDVGEKSIREWTRRVQRLAELRNGERFNAVIALPYDRLFAEPIAIADKHQPGAKLVIVPDGPMHGLPFGALGHANRPLIEDHSVSVEASATLYAFSVAQDEQQAAETRQEVLLFADPEFNERLRVSDDLHSLPNARSEVNRIRTVYEGAANVPPPRMGADATAPTFLRLAAESTIIHLAVHGVANPEVPPRSFLLLAPTGDDQGVVDAERLLKQLQLTKAHLVVLSACSSAGGTPVGPEGLAPLVRPFVAAGVPGVIGTLWNVSDSFVTEDLLVRFHQFYRDGLDADEALRQAQLRVMRDRKGQNIAWAWSAFQLYGRASSPFPSSAVESRRSP